MSIEDLKSDLAANMAEAKSLSAMSTIGDVVNHLKGTLWPFLENVATELTEVDEAMHDLYNNAEDILQHETGRLLAGVVVGGMALVAELEKLVAADPAKHQILAAIREWKQKAKEAGEIIEEITLPEVVDEDLDEDDDGDDDDDGDGDDDDDAKEGATPHA